jgi:hypothetical protein
MWTHCSKHVLTEQRTHIAFPRLLHPDGKTSRGTIIALCALQLKEASLMEAVAFGGALSAIGIAVVLFFVSRDVFGSGRAREPAVVANRVTSITCEEACEQWQAQRQFICEASVRQKEIQRDLDDLRTKFNVALAVMMAAYAAGVVSSLLPWLGAIFFGVAAAALIVTSIIFGQIEALVADRERNQQALEEAGAAEAEARALILNTSVCSIEQAHACLGRPSPC